MRAVPSREMAGKNWLALPRPLGIDFVKLTHVQISPGDQGAKQEHEPNGLLAKQPSDNWRLNDRLQVTMQLNSIHS